MRIISGEFRGRKLKTADLFELRPATDRYRETLFNILNNYIDLENKKVCDLYAGTGAIGFECLSRGAEHCTFVERRFSTVKLIHENAKLLGIESKITVLKDTAERFTSITDEQFDVIFADPPYSSRTIYITVKNILERNLIRSSGILVIQRSKKTKEDDTKNFGFPNFRKIGGDLLFLKIIGEC